VSHREFYEDAARRLLDCGYEIISEGSGYRVQHLTDRLDISLMRNISDLVDFADLVEWAELRRNSGGIMASGSQKPRVE
jgi:hypothetical protein